VLAGVTRSAGAQSGDTLQTMNTGTVTLGGTKGLRRLVLRGS